VFVCQDLDEPGEDTSKYDIIMPTVVRPKSPDIVAVSSGFDCSEVRYVIERYLLTLLLAWLCCQCFHAVC